MPCGMLFFQAPIGSPKIRKSMAWSADALPVTDRKVQHQSPRHQPTLSSFGGSKAFRNAHSTEAPANIRDVLS